jgi:protease II
MDRVEARRVIFGNYTPESYTLLREALDWLLDQAEKVEQLEAENKMLDGLTDDKSKLIEIMEKEICGWKQDSEMYQEYLDSEKNRSELLNERCKRYEIALKAYGDEKGEIILKALGKRPI